MFTIVRQRDFSPVETRVATKYALLNDNPVITTTIRELDSHVDGLRSGEGTTQGPTVVPVSFTYNLATYFTDQ